MKMVFQQKVQEKEAKLKQSEEELYARHKEMKDALERQRADLEEKKRRITCVSFFHVKSSPLASSHDRGSGVERCSEASLLAPPCNFVASTHRRHRGQMYGPRLSNVSRRSRCTALGALRASCECCIVRIAAQSAERARDSAAGEHTFSDSGLISILLPLRRRECQSSVP